MHLVMASQVADRLDLPVAAVEVLMSDAASGIPPSLLDASDGFKLIDALTDLVADAVATVAPDAAIKALNAAAKAGRVPSSLAGEAAEKIAGQLRAIGDRIQLERPFLVGKTPLGELLANGGLEKERHVCFLEHWRANLGETERSWGALLADGSGFKAEEVARLKRTFDISALVKSHLPMLDAVRARIGDEQPLSALAKLEYADWLGIVKSGGDEAVPPNILPGDGESPLELYAREIHERVQRRYPAAPFGEPLDAAIKRHPSLANLFGSQNACSVDPCTSILSPSAYLSDLLLWLRNRRPSPPSPHATALAALRARRPDIPNLELNCANTNTALPYIDLVNELLEDAVSPPAPPIPPATPRWRQTTRSALELRAAPEYVNDLAYGVLASANFPHSLPYDRPFDELSTVLAQSRIGLWQLREAVLPPPPSVASTTQQARIAAAAFGMAPAELDLVTTPAAATGRTSLARVWNTVNPVVDLVVVGDFLAAAQLTYDELLQLLACRWIRAGGSAITISGVDDRCDSSTQRLVGLDADRLDRMHRFLRLWRRTGWAMWELDELLMAPAVGAGTLNAGTMAKLLLVWKLQRVTAIDVEDLLSFWQDIGTAEHRVADGGVQKSLYARVFENPLLPPSPALVLSTLTAVPAPVPAPVLAAHLPAVRAALALDTDEADALVAAVGGSLNLATLSAMYRATRAAEALRIGFEDLAYIAGGTLAAAFASPATTLAVFERTAEVARSGIDLNALRHVLTQMPTSAARTQAQLAEILTAARRALQQINDDVRNTDEPALATLQRQLASLPSLRQPGTLATAISIVDGSFAGTAGDRNAFIATHFGLFMGIPEAQAALGLPLATPPTPAATREGEIAARANALLTPLVRWLTEARVIAAVAAGYSMGEPQAERLLRGTNAPGTTQSMLATLNDPALIARDPDSGAYLRAMTPADFPLAFAALRLLEKQAAVVKALKLSADELRWLLQRGAAISAIALADLPILGTQAVIPIDTWLTTARFFALDRLFDRLRAAATPPANGIASLRDLVDATYATSPPTDTSLREALAAITGWRVEDVRVAATSFGITVASGGWRRVSSFASLDALLRLADTASATVAQVLAWGNAATPNQALANEAWQALQSRYTHQTSSEPKLILERAKMLYGQRASDLEELWGNGNIVNYLPAGTGLRRVGGALLAVQKPGGPTAIPLTFRPTWQENLTTLLRRVPMPFRVVGLSNDRPFAPEPPFMLNDPARTWFVESTNYWLNGSVWQTGRPSAGTVQRQLRFTFTRFFHPFVRTFRYVLSSTGFDGFFQPQLQVDPGAVRLVPGGPPIAGTPFSFRSGYDPVSPIVRWGSDVDTVDFDYSAPYAGYNWELFYHMPLLVANRLSRNQRFDEARRWFHYIFDPTRVSTAPTPQRYWITRPLAEQTSTMLQQQRINELLAAVNRRDADALAQVELWRDDPFNPYLLADLRPAAHMKRVVMSYLDNLIAWGDSLFATASREALNEATLLYVMAAELLGPRPQLLPPPSRASKSWNQLEPVLDAFANALAAIENYVPAGAGGGTPGAGSPPLPAGQTFFFKIPPNDKLLAYWDIVEDRLFKLRHCRGLGGEALSLALFDAPIDPALLVRARAGGLDLAAVLTDLGGAPPNYRFFEMHRRAVDFTQAVIEMGRDLLAALESRDAEALAALLADQRRRVHGDAEQILKWEVDEAKELMKALDYGIELEAERIKNANGAKFMSQLEGTAVLMKSIALAYKFALTVKYLLAAGIRVIPQFGTGVAGVGGSPQASASTGGQTAAEAAEYQAKSIEKLAEFHEKGADIIKVFAEADKAWVAKQKDGKLAGYEKKRLEREHAAADLRLQIAEYRLAQHAKVGDNLDAEREYLVSKFSNTALYDWMVDQLSGVYFRGFRLAMSMARRAERCYRFELGMLDSNVVGPNTWDSMRRGLLAGQNLAHDLRRLESSYLDLNVRRKETTRTVSLRREFPVQMLLLLTSGTCDFDLPELLFDRDYPGHYQRRILRASISVQRPGADPHDNVVCVATLVLNSVRLTPSLGAGYLRLTGTTTDARFADQFAPVQGIVTGNAIEDPGLFVRDITDNLADPRYLPFENAGVIGRWRLELPPSRNAIDLSTVTDVKLHLHYSALDGGLPLTSAAQATVDDAARLTTTTKLVFDASSEFADEWAAFLAGSGGEQRFVLPLRKGLLPPLARNRTVMITACRVHVLSDHGGRFDVELLAPLPPATAQAVAGASGALLSTASFTLPSLSMRAVALRIREQGATDWTSLASERIGGLLIELDLGLS